MANPITDIAKYAAQRLLVKPTKQSGKASFTPSGLWPILGTNANAGMIGRSQDLTQSKWGAAAAYSLIEPVYRSTTLRAQAIDSLPWRFVKQSSGDIITTSEDTKPQLSITRAMRRVRREMSNGFFFLWEVSLCLYGNVFFELARNASHYVSGLEWLNPLGMTIQEAGGKVQTYHYSSGAGSVPYLPHQIAHDRKFNPNDDFDGYSPTLVALNKANVELSTSKSWNAFFRNGAIPGGIVTPKEGDGTLDNDDLTLLGKIWETLFKGSLNTSRFGILPFPLDVVTFDQPDFEKQVTLSTAMINSIYRTFGVPMALAGDTGTGGLGKENTDETGQNFFVSTLRPESEGIARAFNDILLPKFPDMQDVRFEFDYSPFEQVGTAEKNRAETITAHVNLGALDLFRAQEQLGIEPDERLKDVYLFGGVPIHIDEVVRVASSAEDAAGEGGELFPELDIGDAKSEGLAEGMTQDVLNILENMRTGAIAPSVTVELLIAHGLEAEQADRIVARQTALIQEAIDEYDDTKAAAAGDIFVNVALPNNKALAKIQAQLMDKIDGNIQLQDADKLHMTLLYAQKVSESDISDIADQVDAANVNIESNALGVFVNDGESAIHLVVEPSKEIMDLQKNIYAAFSAKEISVSKFSNPAAYTPHITIATGIEIGELPPMDFVFDESANSIQIQKDDFEEIAVIDAKAKADDDYITERYAKIKRELSAWQKFATKSRDRAFEPEHSRGEYADILSAEPNKANFDKAFEKLNGSIKAIANTRNKFIKDFDALLSSAAKGSITRRSWSAKVRRLIKLASAFALSDGLRDAGVEGSLEDEEFNDEFDKVERIVKQQSTFVTDLGARLFTGKVADGELAGKGLMWWNKSILPAYSEGVVAGKANQMMEFVGKDGEKSCITCRRLKGQRHRAKDWKRKQLWPRKDTDNFVCTGRQCNHNLKPVSARSRGNWLRDAPGKWA